MKRSSAYQSAAVVQVLLNGGTRDAVTATNSLARRAELWEDRAMNGSPESRTLLIEEGAAAVGRLWALQLVATLRQEKRATAGGWPATLSEARSQVGIGLSRWLTQRGHLPIAPAEAEAAARLVYAMARREWQSHREPEVDAS